MLKVWGRVNSINVQKVIWTLAELELKHEQVNVGGAYGGLDTPEYGTLNPNRKIPVLQDGALALWESNAIVRYLAANYGPKDGPGDGLCPADPKQRALADMWMDWQVSTLLPAIAPAFHKLIRNSPDYTEEDLRNAERNCADAFRILEDWLIGHDYLLGERLTMADIPVGAVTHRWLKLPFARPRLPRVEAYYRRLAERPAYAQHVMLPLT